MSQVELPENFSQTVSDAVSAGITATLKLGVGAAPLSCYKGDMGSQSFTSFVAKFEHFAAIHDWNEEDKLKFLPSYLSDKAIDIFESLEDDHKDTFENAVIALKRRFCPSYRANTEAILLHNRKQKPGESVSSYSQDIETMASTVYKNIDAGARKTLLLQIFLQGLHPSLKLLVLASNPLGFDEAYNEAQKQESAYVACYGILPSGTDIDQADLQFQFDDEKSLFKEIERLNLNSRSTQSSRFKPGYSSNQSVGFVPNVEEFSPNRYRNQESQSSDQSHVSSRNRNDFDQSQYNREEAQASSQSFPNLKHESGTPTDNRPFSFDQPQVQPRSFNPRYPSQQPPSNTGRRPDVPHDLRRPANSVVCYFCGKQGHYANECPQNSRNRSRIDSANRPGYSSYQ